MREFLIALRFPQYWWGIRHLWSLYRRCARILAYIPVIWDNEDWDYGYILELLRYKIKRTRNHIAQYRRHVDWETDVQNMNEAIGILDRLIADDYCREDWDAFYDKWNPERTLRFETTDEGMGRIKPMEKEELADFRSVSDKDFASTEADWKNLWALLERHMRNWWD